MIAFKLENLDFKSRALHEKAVASAGRYAIAEAELLEVIAEVSRARLFEKFGEAYITPYCVKYLNLSEHVAANFVRIARKSEQVPELKLAVDIGVVDISKARTISSVITKENQERWIEKASTLSKRELEREVAEANPSGAKPERIKSIGNDKSRIGYDCRSEDVENLRRVQDLESKRLGRAVSIEEANRAAYLAYLEKNDPIEKAKRIAKRQERFRGQSQDSLSRNKNLAQLRDKGACQAKLPNGTICGITRWTHIHHVKEKSRGGTDELTNLITLCSSHHRQWHRG